MAKVFRIRAKDTGLYSSGGQVPTFDKKGKAWTNIGHVKNHLIEVARCKGTWNRIPTELAIPENWELVEFEVHEEQLHVVSAREVYEQGRQKREIERTHRRR